MGQALNRPIYNLGPTTTSRANMLIANYNDHCIFEVSSTGALSVELGICANASVNTETFTDATIIRFPTAVAYDPLYQSDGNLFFADLQDLSPSRVRYDPGRSSRLKWGGADSVDHFALGLAG